jgi:hypothetical protein
VRTNAADLRVAWADDCVGCVVGILVSLDDMWRFQGQGAKEEADVKYISQLHMSFGESTVPRV